MLRRMWSVGFVVAFSIVLSACNWSMFGSDAAHTRFDQEGVGMTTANVGSMVVKGTARQISPVQFFSSPALVATGSHGTVTYTAYVGCFYGLCAIDAFGSTGCSGTPPLCSPLWT